MANLKQRLSEKVLSIILVLTLIVAMLPMGILTVQAAVKTAPINLTGVTSDTSGVNWEYIHSIKTLYLNGVNINSGVSDTITVPSGTIIETIGLNTLKSASDWSTINGLGDLTLQGSGVLDVECSDNTGRGDAIYTEGSLTIKSGYIKAYMSDSNSSTAVASYGPMFIEGGYLDTSANKSMGGISSNDEDTGIVISGGYVKAHGDGATGNNVTYGIASWSTIFVEGGYLEATSGNAKNITAAIKPSGSFNNTGGVVKATSGYSSDWHSYGIFAGSYASFDGGVTIAKAGGAEGELAAVKTGSTIYLSSGELAKAGSDLSALEIELEDGHFFTNVGGSYPATDVVVAKRHHGSSITALDGGDTELNGYYIKVGTGTGCDIVANLKVTGGNYIEGEVGFHSFTSNISGDGTLVGVGTGTTGIAKVGVFANGFATSGTVIGISDTSSGVHCQLAAGGTGYTGVTGGNIIGISSNSSGIYINAGDISHGNFIGISISDRSGIRATSNNAVLISGGNLTAYTTAASTQPGESPLYAWKDMTISGGSITAIGNRPSGDSYAIIHNIGNLTISGGKVYAYNKGTGDAIRSHTSLTTPGISLGGLASSATYGDALVNATVGATTHAVEVGGVVTQIVFLGGPSLTSITHTITYNYDGADGGNSEATVATGTDGKIVILPTPTKTGYTFGGWYQESGLITVVDTNTVFTANKTIYAKWTVNTYTVTFDANSGTGIMSNQTYTNGIAQTLTTNTFTRAGYTFKSWNTVASGTGTSYSDSQSAQIAADTTLYAQWKAVSDDPQTGDSGDIGLVITLMMLSLGVCATLLIKRRKGIAK